MRDHPGSGSVSYVSNIDGVRRLGSYQHLNQYPLSTLVSRSEWDVQSSWRAELRTHAIILLCVMSVVAVLGSRAVSANRLLNAQAMRDSLTGLANRRFFDETIEREFRRAGRAGRSISIVMIDIDHFKDYNDCYGHPAGDECLRAIARTVQDCVQREGEMAARYGGEEIAVILPGCDAAAGVRARGANATGGARPGNAARAPSGWDRHVERRRGDPRAGARHQRLAGPRRGRRFGNVRSQGGRARQSGNIRTVRSGCFDAEWRSVTSGISDTERADKSAARGGTRGGGRFERSLRQSLPARSCPRGNRRCYGPTGCWANCRSHALSAHSFARCFPSERCAPW